MPSRKWFLLACAAALVFSMLLTACSGGGDSTATPGTGAEHSLPSAQAGYPEGGGFPTPGPGYPQP
jgi:hypothetical protein